MSPNNHATMQVLEDLLEARSGVEFIYSCLDKVAHRYDLEDVLLVVQDEMIGKQVYRLGRAPISFGWPADVAFDGPPGLHSRPDGVFSDEASAALVGMARVALRMEMLRHRSRIDPLTGLLNRHGFDEHLQQAIDRFRRYGQPFTVLLVDLDNFKAVNDQRGHPAGDRLLEQVAEKLEQLVRGGDVAARHGGDEFALLLTEAPRQAAEQVAARLQRDLPSSHEGIPIGLSVGSATCPDDASTFVELYEIADRRLYHDKRRT